MGTRNWKTGVFSCLDSEENKEERKQSVGPIAKGFLSFPREKKRERRVEI